MEKRSSQGETSKYEKILNGSLLTREYIEQDIKRLMKTR